MDPGQRRRPTARAARLSVLLLANLAAVFLLVRSLTGGDGEVEAGDVQVAEMVSSETLAAAAPVSAPVVEAVAEPVPDPGDVELARRLEGQVASAVARAAERSGGKVTAANTVVALHVLDPGSGRVLVARQSDRALRPASALKLVTSAAALVSLGPDGAFETSFESAAPIEGGVLRGDLVVRAGGDPFYDPDARGAVAQLYAPALRALRDAGIAAIEGDLVLDEGSYLEPGPAPGWPSADQHWQEHCALAGGFSANAGCLTAVVEAGRAGEGARSEVRPRNHGLERVGSVRTVGAKARLDIAVGATEARATLRGEIPSSVKDWSSRFAHPDPVALFGSSFMGALEREGIDLRGVVRRERGVPAARRLALLSTPLARVLAPINQESNNAAADQLFLALGAARGGAGTREGGRRAVAAALAELGVPDDGLVQVDGSGLSRDDRVTARQLATLLGAVLAEEPSLREPFVDSLPRAGRSGSLAGRMREAPALDRVRAKTGWIEGASALAGYVDAAGGRRLCFAILVDYPRVSGLNTHCWKPMQDAICAELATWSPAGGRVR